MTPELIFLYVFLRDEFITVCLINDVRLYLHILVQTLFKI